MMSVFPRVMIGPWAGVGVGLVVVWVFGGFFSCLFYGGFCVALWAVVYLSVGLLSGGEVLRRFTF